MKTYLCIDLKCFYASVECADRGLDPFTTNLVVADPTRGDKTICLAITPAMKALGIRNRCRVYEIPDGVEYQKAMPRMRRYMEVSAQIYQVYLRFFSAEDIHVYSIDECFIDVTPYVAIYGNDARALAKRVMAAIYDETRITATAGIGTNLFLCKVALDVTAKHVPDNIGYLDDAEFKRLIWKHQPITDIWGIGPGIARRLATYGVHDLMGVALMDEDLLYREFGVKAELLRDHAWGEEPVTIADIKRYRPKGHSLSSGQVLPCDYDFDAARIVLREMVDGLALDLVDKGLVTGQVSLGVGYTAEKLAPSKTFTGEHGTRRLGPGFEGSHASHKLAAHTASRAKLTQAFLELFDEVMDPNRTIRRISLGAGDLLPEEFAEVGLFDNVEAEEAERRLAKATLAVKEKFGKNALVRLTSLQGKATGRERNEQVGGHHE